MRTRLLYSTLLMSVLAVGFAGCEGEHEKFKKEAKQTKDWELQRVDIRYQVAEQQYRVGELDKCRESLKEALAINAPYAPIYILAAKVEMEGGSLDVATTHLKRAAAINGKDGEPLYLLGVVYQRIQKFETALDYYRQASEKNVNEARYVLATAEMQITLGKLDDAKQFLEDKMGFFEQSAALHIALARIASLKGDSATAAKSYRDAHLLMPEDKNIRWSYASALFDAGKYSDAAHILEDMRSDPPTLPKAVGVVSSKTPEAVKAANAEAEALAAASNKATLLMMLGECYVGMNRAIEARDCFQEVIHMQPENVSAYLALGKACLLTEELNLTVSAAQRVLRLRPDNLDALILQAAAQQKQKNWTEAQSTLTRAARLSPKDTNVLCMQGLVALQMGEKDAATAYFVKAVAMNPGDAWATSLLEQVSPPPVVVPVAPATPIVPVPVVPAPAAIPAPVGAEAADATPLPQAMERAAVDPAAVAATPIVATPVVPTVQVAAPENP